ncbi:MAG: hypothetical protein M1833_003012, partial [Piccolia ochrophora]
CLTVKREDFGWGSDNRVLHPVDAEREGAVTIEELRQPIPPSAGEVASAADQAPTTAVNNVPPPSTAKPAPKEIQRKPAAKPVQPSTSPARAEGKAGSAASTISNGVHETLTKNADKAEKKKKKRADDDDVISRGTEASQPVNTHSSKALVQSQAQDEKPVASPSLERPSVSTNADVSTVNLGVSGDFMNKEIRKIEKAVSAEFSKTMSKELNTLYQRFNEDKRIMQAAGDAKQDAVLRLVSSTLSENVEKSLARIIGQTVQQAVVPSIAEVTAATLNQTLSQVVRDHLEHALPREIRSAVPDAIGRVFQSADLLRSISNHVSSKVGAHVESDFAAVLQGTITPAFKELALTAAHSVAGEVERRTAEQLRKAEEVRQRDVRKVESLHELVRGLTQTVTRMASSQADFQREILKLNRHVSHPQPRQEEKSRGPSRQQHEGLPQRNEQPAQAEQTPEQEELELIASTMREGRYEEATIRWLQSQQQVDLFDRFFIRFGPAYVQTLSQLVLLSVAASVTASFDTNVNERLDWVEACFSSLNFRDAEVRDVLPRIIDVLVQRLESLYMRLAQKSLQDPALRKIPGLTTLARELKNNALQVA